MSYWHYNHTRERGQSPYYEESDSHYRPLVRRNSKRQRIDVYDDDEYDDYPRTPSKPSKPSRALTIRQPTKLEKYNVYNEQKRDSEEDRKHRHYRHVHKHYTSQPNESDDERDFQLKIKAKFSRPKSSHSSSEKMTAWPGEMFKRREKWEGVDWESRERDRADSVWEDKPVLTERTVRYRKIKRTRTDEWKPLSGFRRL